MQIPEWILPIKQIDQLDPAKPFDKFWLKAEHPTDLEVIQLDLQLLQYLSPVVMKTGKGFSVPTKDGDVGPYVAAPPLFPERYLLLPAEGQRANVFGLFSQTEKGMIGTQSLSFHEYKSLVIQSLESPVQRMIRKDMYRENNRFLWRNYDLGQWRGMFDTMTKILETDNSLYALLAETLLETGKAQRVSYYETEHKDNWHPPSDAIIPTNFGTKEDPIYICLSGQLGSANFLFTPEAFEMKLEGSLPYPKFLNYLDYAENEGGRLILTWSQNPYAFKVFLAQALAEQG